MEEEYLNLLNSIQKDLYTNKTNKLNPEFISRLHYLSKEINAKRKSQKDDQKKPSGNDSMIINTTTRAHQQDKENVSINEHPNPPQKAKRIRPAFIRLRDEVFSPECLDECILEFLSIGEILQIRLVSRTFNQGAQLHLSERIVEEEKNIESLIFASEESSLLIKELVVSQFPKINGQWLNLNTKDLVQKLESLFTRLDLESLKHLHNIPDKYQDFFAPLCAIFEATPTKFQLPDGSYEKNWRKSFLQIVSSPWFVTKVLALDIRDIKEKTALNLLQVLNKISNRVDEVRSLSFPLSLTVIWCQTVFGVYLSKNIYKVRYPEKIEKEEDLMIMKQLETKVVQSRKLKKIIGFETNEPYLIDLSTYKPKEKNTLNLVRDLDEELIKNIVSFIDIKEIISSRRVCRKFKKAVDEYIKHLVTIGFYTFESAKLKIVHLNKKIPLLFEFGFLSVPFNLAQHLFKMRAFFFSKGELDEFKRINRPSQTQNKLCQVYCILYKLSPVREYKMDDASVKLNHFTAVKNLLIGKNYKSTLEKLDIFDIPLETLLEVQNILDSINPKSLGPADSIFTNFYNFLKLMVVFYKLMNPLPFISKKFLSTRLNKEEVEDLRAALEKYDDCIFFLRIATRLKLADVDNSLKAADAYLTEDERQLQKSIQKGKFDQLQEIYFESYSQNTEYTLPILLQKVTASLIELYQEEEKTACASCPMKQESAQTQFQSHQEIQKPKKKFTFDFKTIDLVVVKYCLNFLTLEDLVPFARANKACSQIYKIYMHIRVLGEVERVKQIEDANKEIVTNIEIKRDQFYKYYEQEPPTRENAISCITEVSHLTITELKKIKKTSPLLERYATPFLIIFDEALSKHKIEAKLNSKNKWAALLKLMQVTDVYKIISELQVEVLDGKKIFAIEKYLQNNKITPKEASNTSSGLRALVNWLYGVVEIHKYIRKYYLSDYDYEILNEEEIEFAKKQDYLQVRSYKLIRALETFWAAYQEAAHVILQTMKNEDMVAEKQKMEKITEQIEEEQKEGN